MHCRRSPGSSLLHQSLCPPFMIRMDTLQTGRSRAQVLACGRGLPGCPDIFADLTKVGEEAILRYGEDLPIMA